MDFIVWLFNTSHFIPRIHCGIGWTTFLINLNKFSNFLIFLAYFLISITLFYFWCYRRREVPASYILIFFANFILFCGFTHLCDVLAFTWPAYRFFTVINIITSIFSVVTAIILPYIIAILLKVPSITRQIQLVQQLQVEISKREIIEAECNKNNKMLKMKIEELENQIKHKVWVSKTEDLIQELKNMLNKGSYGNL
jgi:hypothetical protein